VWLFATDASLEPRHSVVEGASRGLGGSAEKRLAGRILSGAFSIANTINCDTISNNQVKLGSTMMVSMLAE
jgi:hypothetical protein